VGTDEKRPRDESGPDGNDMPPSGEEARAQRKATTMPLIWLLLGVGLVALFVILLAIRSPHQLAPNALPTKSPPAAGVGTAPPSKGDVETTTGPPPQDHAR
jgi:hypothetical protein